VEAQALAMEELLLLPAPRRLERLGGSSPLPATLTVAGADPSLVATTLGDRGCVTYGRAFVRCAIDPAAVVLPGDEAYRLAATAEGVTIAARGTTGLRWGLCTLAQLAATGRIPHLVIDDAPLFPNRGVMLDISRDRVPTMATLRGLVDRISAWKMNHLQLYVEHTLAYRGHEAVWRAADPLTLDELSELDSYCVARGVALTANQNCFAHMERWLRVPAYAELSEGYAGSGIADLATPVDWWQDTLMPGDPRVLELIEDLLGQQFPRCSGAYANIGCDEATLSGCRTREAIAQRGIKTVFTEHLVSVAAIARRLGKRPQFWCDPHPLEGDGLPLDLTALVWGYQADSEFAPRLRAHIGAGREAWVAPGTSCYKSVTGRTWNRRCNLDRAAREGSECGATGYLCTTWGDDGHQQQWPLTLIGYADAAQAAWHGAGSYDDRAAGFHAFASPELGEWLARLGDVDREMRLGLRPSFDGNPGPRASAPATELWKELATPLHERSGPGDIAAWKAVAAGIDELAASLPPCDALVRAELDHALSMARWICDRAVLRRGVMTADGRRALFRRMSVLIRDFRFLWLKRSRYGGLEDSCMGLRKHFEQLDG
jgi:hypothetical protein